MSELVICLLALAITVAAFVFFIWLYHEADPKPGELFVKREPNPFDNHNAATILEVSAGWVRYRASGFGDASTEPIWLFMRTYRRARNS